MSDPTSAGDEESPSGYARNPGAVFLIGAVLLAGSTAVAATVPRR